MERSPWEVEILWLLCCILLYRHHLLFVDDSICLTIAIEVDIDAVNIFGNCHLPDWNVLEHIPIGVEDRIGYRDSPTSSSIPTR